MKCSTIEIQLGIKMHVLVEIMFKKSSVRGYVLPECTYCGRPCTDMCAELRQTMNIINVIPMLLFQDLAYAQLGEILHPSLQWIFSPNYDNRLNLLIYTPSFPHSLHSCCKTLAAISLARKSMRQRTNSFLL